MSRDIKEILWTAWWCKTDCKEKWNYCTLSDTISSIALESQISTGNCMSVFGNSTLKHLARTDVWKVAAVKCHVIFHEVGFVPAALRSCVTDTKVSQFVCHHSSIISNPKFMQRFRVREGGNCTYHRKLINHEEESGWLDRSKTLVHSLVLNFRQTGRQGKQHIEISPQPIPFCSGSSQTGQNHTQFTCFLRKERETQLAKKGAVYLLLPLLISTCTSRFFPKTSL